MIRTDSNKLLTFKSRDLVRPLPRAVAQPVRKDERSDPQLIQACLVGDQTAWKSLVNRYSRLVYSIPFRYGLSAADADDVFQNVFSIVFRRLTHLRDQSRLSAWLIAITHHETIRVGKRAGITDELDDMAPDGAPPPQEMVEELERQHLVHRALDQLGEPCRELVKSLCLDPDDVSYEKLAARLGMPVGSIGPTRARCFKKLEAILVSLGIDERS